MTKDRAPGASSPPNEKGGENHMQTETVQNIPAIKGRLAYLGITQERLALAMALVIARPGEGKSNQ